MMRRMLPFITACTVHFVPSRSCRCAPLPPPDLAPFDFSPPDPIFTWRVVGLKYARPTWSDELVHSFCRRGGFESNDHSNADDNFSSAFSLMKLVFCAGGATSPLPPARHKTGAIAHESILFEICRGGVKRRPLYP